MTLEIGNLPGPEPERPAASFRIVVANRLQATDAIRTALGSLFGTDDQNEWPALRTVEVGTWTPDEYVEGIPGELPLSWTAEVDVRWGSEQLP